MSQTNQDGERVRVRTPQRKQIEWRAAALDELLPPEHRVRLVWDYVAALDLAPLYRSIQAVEGAAGRDAVDPRILLALWMFATIDGVSSARELDRLCQRDIAYLWICGGVGVNYDLLSRFRSGQGEFLERLLTDTIATLTHQRLITLEIVAQDGMRVRASAGSGSFRREKSLQDCQEQARRHVQSLREREEDPDDSGDSTSARRTAARQRAAREREQRVAQALEELQQLRQRKEERKKSSGEQARCSTTDPEARVMKMGDGGFRPAYNVQFATDGGTRMIVGVDVTNSGSDRGRMAPLHESLQERYGKAPGSYLVDCGFVTHEDVTAVELRGSRVIAPLFSEDRLKRKGVDPYARQRRDTDETFAFRQRMATDAAQALLKQRPSIAEFPNAECRNRGLHQLRVRGLVKAKTVALWHAVTFNLLRMWRLGLA
jgi:transposase